VIPLPIITVCGEGKVLEGCLKGRSPELANGGNSNVIFQAVTNIRGRTMKGGPELDKIRTGNDLKMGAALARGHSGVLCVDFSRENCKADDEQDPGFHRISSLMN
jgi:hypothetical protein